MPNTVQDMHSKYTMCLVYSVQCSQYCCQQIVRVYFREVRTVFIHIHSNGLQ